MYREVSGVMLLFPCTLTYPNLIGLLLEVAQDGMDAAVTGPGSQSGSPSEQA